MTKEFDRVLTIQFGPDGMLGLKDGLTLEAFADLVAYLESLREPAK